MNDWNFNIDIDRLSQTVQTATRSIAHLNEQLPYVLSTNHINNYVTHLGLPVVDLSAAYRSIMDRIRGNNFKLDIDIDELLEVLCRGDRSEILEIVISPDILNCIDCYNVYNIEYSMEGSVQCTYYGHNLYIDGRKNKYIKIINKFDGEEHIINFSDINNDNGQEDVDINESEFEALLSGS